MKQLLIPTISKSSAWERLRISSLQSEWIVRLFYFTMVALVFRFFGFWETFANRPQIVTSWAGEWICNSASQEMYVGIVAFILTTSSLILCMNPFYLYVRLINFIALHVFLSYYIATHGYANHNYYGFSVISFALLLLPNNGAEKRTRSNMIRTNIATWGGGVLLVSIYALVGIANLHGGIYELIKNGFSIFNPISIAYFVAEDLIVDGKSSIFGNFVIEHYIWFGPLVTLMIFEKMIGLPIYMRYPKYLPLWGFAILLFHLFNAFAFSLPFVELSMQILLFVILNPVVEMNSNFVKISRLKKVFSLHE